MKVGDTVMYVDYRGRISKIKIGEIVGGDKVYDDKGEGYYDLMNCWDAERLTRFLEDD